MDMAGLLGRLFRRQRTPELRCSAVVPAAGSSTRMEGQDKLLLPLEEQPVLLHTLRALELCPYLAEIIVVTREDLIVPIGQLCRDAGLSKVRKVIVGGATRTHSVLAGLGELSSGAELVAIHDGARPLCDKALIRRVLRDAIAHGNRLIMMYDGRIVIDVSGEEKKKLTVPDLLALFSKVSGSDEADDKLLLS